MGKIELNPMIKKIFWEFNGDNFQAEVGVNGITRIEISNFDRYGGCLGFWVELYKEDELFMRYNGSSVCSIEYFVRKQ